MTPPEHKTQTVVIHVVENDDSLLISLFTFLASLSFVFLCALIALIFWIQPAVLEPVSKPTRELWSQFHARLVARIHNRPIEEPLISTDASIQPSRPPTPQPSPPNEDPSESTATSNIQVVPAPNIQPSYMTAEEALKETPASPVVPEDVRLNGMTTDTLLNDPLGRITDDFSVPPKLKKRVAFWFDVYTKYSSLFHVIHHDRYPWIVFRVVDGTPFMSTRGPEWLRRDRGAKQAQKEIREIKYTLSRMSRYESFQSLTPQELQLYNLLLEVPGPRRRVFRQAAESVRIQLGQRDFYINGLRNSAKYLPYMEDEMRKRGLPTELTRLPFVESSFNEKAESRVGASGVWQIMPRTGKAYLMVTDFIDERNSPLKATRVAAYIFKTYFHALKSWPLTITSYNHGIGNIQKAIHGAQSRDLPTIIERYHEGDFKFASSNFFSCFLAALYAEKYQEVVFPTLSKLGLLEQESLLLPKRIRVDQVIKVLDMDTEKFLAYNMDLKRVVQRRGILPKGYELHIPLGMKERVHAQLGIERETPASPRKQAGELQRGRLRDKETTLTTSDST